MASDVVIWAALATGAALGIVVYTAFGYLCTIFVRWRRERRLRRRLVESLLLTYAPGRRHEDDFEDWRGRWRR